MSVHNTDADTEISTNLQKHTNPNPAQRWLIERFHATAARLFATTQARTVLDAGCGEGFALNYLLGDNAAKVIGLDGSQNAVQLARQLNPQRHFMTGDLLHLPFPDNHFDAVMCLEVLEHLDDPAWGLRELCRVSHQWLLLSVPNEPLFRGANFLRGKNMHALGNDPGHVNHWSTRSFVRFVSQQCQVHTWRRSFPWTLVLCQVA
jgi:SAM-dependent methyltransferase